VRFVDGRAAVGYRQPGWVRVRAATSGWVAATFVHRTSRAGDPQLHAHAVVPNVVRCDRRVWVAFDASDSGRYGSE
jgi:conjugative relaxase-like TrwC/TraI family protein